MHDNLHCNPRGGGGHKKSLQCPPPLKITVVHAVPLLSENTETQKQGPYTSLQCDALMLAILKQEDGLPNMPECVLTLLWRSYKQNTL